MHFSRHSLSLTTSLALCVPGVFSVRLGPRYPAPVDLTSKGSAVAAGWTNLTSALESQASLANLTFSVSMFSIHDNTAAETLQFHQTAPDVANSAEGVGEADGDSIYRIASISKLFTVYAGMLLLDTADWDRSIADVFPELQEEAAQEMLPLRDIPWHEVTLASLGAQISGLPREALPWAADIIGGGEAARTNLGLPPLNLSDPTVVGPCPAQNLTETCPGDLFLDGEQFRRPIFQPWTTPMYSNDNFVVLGLAIAKITGLSLDEIYHEHIFKPLGMKLSNSTVPDFSQSVIPVSAEASFFGLEGGISKASGGLFSTVNDLAKFGTSILNSTLLSATETRKWMKPQSHTAGLRYSTGRPWEIYRYTHPLSGKVTDIYTKLGDAGSYGGFIALIPDYDAGFSVIGASLSKLRSPNTAVVADLVTATIIPALEAQAAQEASRNLAGTYESTTAGFDASLTLSVDKTNGTGLVVTEWTSNSTDVLAVLKTAYDIDPLRLQPSISDCANGQIAFVRSTVLTDPTIDPQTLGLFTGQYTMNFDWLAGSSLTYGTEDLTHFAFDLDDDGKAKAVSPLAYRVKLERTE